MSATPLLVGVFGAHGRMGSLVCQAVRDAPDLVLAGAVGSQEPREEVAGAEVLVDFTNPDAAMDNIRWAIERGTPIVVGTSGFDEQRLAAVAEWLKGAVSGVMIVPNFCIGAVLAMRLAAIAAPHFSSIDILDFAHRGKLDAPSGTALRAAQLIAGERAAEASAGDLGDEHRPVERTPQINIQSIRLDGVFFQQDFVFGRQGETLSIKVNTASREAYLPGVLLAVRTVRRRPGLTVGLEHVLGIE